MPIDDRLWEAIRSLEGQPLQTIGRGNSARGAPFTIRRDTPYQITALPNRGEPRPIRRLCFDQVLDLGVPVDQLRPSMLNAAGPRMVCASYVVGILRELGRRGLL